MDFGLFWMRLQTVGLLIRPFSSVWCLDHEAGNFVEDRLVRFMSSPWPSEAGVGHGNPFSGILHVGLSKLTVGRAGEGCACKAGFSC